MRRLWMPLTLAAAATVVYLNSLSGAFVFDDIDAIVANSSIRRLWPPWPSASTISESAVSGRPLVILSLSVNYALGGLHVTGYHLFNLFVHVLSGLVLWAIVRRTLSRPRLDDRYAARAPWLAYAAALLWLVHPLQTDSVTYIVQRTELLMGLFYLLTLYCAIRGADSAHPRPWYAAAVLSCGLGMASKEVMVTAPLIVLLYDRIFLSGSFKETLRARWPLYSGLAATWLILAALLWTGPPHASAGFGFDDLSWLDYARTQIGVVVHYLRLCLWPHPLVLDYDWPIARTWSAVDPFAAAVLATLIALTFASLARRPMLGFLGAWFFLVLAPTSSILPLRPEVMAERRLHLPLAAVVVLAVVAADTLWYRLRPTPRSSPTWPPLVVLLTVALALGALSVRRNIDYRTEASIWTDAIAKRPLNPRAHANLGVVLTEQGKLDEAVAYLSEALRLVGLAEAGVRPLAGARELYIKTQTNLGAALLQKGLPNDAVPHLSEALRLKPDLPGAHYNLAAALAAQGESDRAAEHYREALRLKPDAFQAHYNLANVLVRIGRLDQAAVHYAAALRLNPNLTEAHHNLAVVLHKTGHAPQAISHYREAIRLSPRSLAPALALAWILATDLDPALRDGAEAVRLAERASRTPGAADATALDTLAAAYAETGRYLDALNTANRAIQLAEAAGQTSLAAEIRGRTQLYRAGRPFRSPHP